MICSWDFRVELSQILPLRVLHDQPFLRRFSSEKARELRKLLHDSGLGQTIDVYFGVQEEGELQQLWKYFPRFSSKITFPDDDVRLDRRGEFG